MKIAKIKTEVGTMKVNFYFNDAPNTVANFIKLAEEGFEVTYKCATNGDGVDFELPMLDLDLSKDELPQAVIIGKCGLYDEWQKNYMLKEL